MRETQWLEWTRTRLEPREREDLSTALTSDQNARLLEHDYVLGRGIRRALETDGWRTTSYAVHARYAPSDEAWRFLHRLRRRRASVPDLNRDSTASERVKHRQ